MSAKRPLDSMYVGLVCADTRIGQTQQYGLHPTQPIVQETTKICSRCGCEDSVKMNTLRLKSCANCGLWIHWPKDQQQADWL